MTQINVKDAAGSVVAVARVADTGSVGDAASLPVALSTEAKAAVNAGNASLASIDGKTPALSGGNVPVTIAGTVSLPTGASTAANQATEIASLSSIDGKTPALSGGAVPVTAAALPLPTGAATSAAQGTGNTSLASIDTKTPALSGGAVPVTAAALPLPAGAATSAAQGTTNTSLASIDTKTPALSGGAVPVVAATLPLPTGASTAAKQPALGTAGAASADVISVQGVASMTALKVDGSAVTQPVSAASLPLPTGAATSAKQPALGAATQANSIPVVQPTDPDIRPVSGNITVIDSGSVSTAATPITGGASTNQITGTATAGSTYSQACNGSEVARTQVSGTWTGTLTFEVSLDSGTTWQAAGSHVSGTTSESATINGNGQFITLVAGCTNFRLRATAAMTGTAVVQTVLSASGGIIKNNGGAVTVSYAGITPTDKSGTITAGNTAQAQIAANPIRKGFSIQNVSVGDLWINSLATAIIGQPSMKIPPNGLYESPAGGTPVGAVSIIGATTGQAFAAREW